MNPPDTQRQRLDHLLQQARLCTSRKEARRLVADEALRCHQEHPAVSELFYRANLRDSIGCAAAYMPREEATRVLELFETEHPWYGAVENFPRIYADAMKLRAAALG